MRRPPTMALAVPLLGLLAVTFSLHPRATLPVVALAGLLGVARLYRTAALVLALLLIATLAGVRVDAAPPAPTRVK